MLYVLILEAILVLALGWKVLADEKVMDEAFKRWMSQRPVQKIYRIPLRIIVRREIKETAKHIARHRYVHP